MQGPMTNLIKIKHGFSCRGGFENFILSGQNFNNGKLCLMALLTESEMSLSRRKIWKNPFFSI